MLAGPDKRPTLRELEILRAMIRSGKTVAAARALGISQPAVSRSLASLEVKFGRALFVKDGTRLMPTAEALRLDHEAARVMDALAQLTPGARARESGPLRIVAAPTMAQFLLPPAVSRLRAREPDILVSVEISAGVDVLSAVADRRADIGVIDGPVAHPALRGDVFFREIAHVVLPEGHALAQREHIGAIDLIGSPLVALARRFPSRAEIDAAFATTGQPMRLAAEVSTAAFAVQLVRAGLGVAILNPFPLWLGGLAGLVARPFTPVVPYESRLLTPLTGGHHPTASLLGDILRDIARTSKVVT